MKKVDAWWEKRNLGVTTLEIEFEENDDVEIVETDYSDYNYIVAKVPKMKLDIVHKLESIGFNFMESQMELYKKVDSNTSIPAHLERIAEQVKYERVTEEAGLDIVLGGIEPDMFNTDRISIDSYFGTDIGAQRMRNWVRDEFSKEGSELYTLIYQGDRIGFSLLKKVNNKKVFMLLGGMFKNFKDSGLGFTIIEKPISLAMDRNIGTLVTRVSSNNINVIKLYSLFGFTISNIYYVLRKYNKY